MEKSARSIEVAVISGEDLRLGTKPVKENVFVVIRTEGCDDLGCSTSKMSNGSTSDGKISWNNEKLHLDLPNHAGFLTVEVYTNARLVGSATIPVTDFLGGYGRENQHVQFLSYRLRDGYGVKNGVINVSVKVRNPARVTSMPSVPWQPEIGFPMRNRDFGGVVVGIPVWYASACTY